MGVRRTEDNDAASESALDSTGKDTINLQTLRPMEANIFLTLYGMKVELTKVRDIIVFTLTTHKLTPVQRNEPIRDRSEWLQAREAVPKVVAFCLCF